MRKVLRIKKHVREKIGKVWRKRWLNPKKKRKKKKVKWLLEY